MVQIVTAAEALQNLVRNQMNAVDVRSEGEFSQGHVPGFLNFPILRDSERHEVGLSYKHEGQEAAIELGHRLVQETRQERVDAWARQFEKNGVGILTCWRGGMRSELAAQWLQETGLDVLRVQGGYQAMRGELLKTFVSFPDFWVLAGPTGSGKTKLIESLTVPKINLEAHAVHRGSAFGGFAHLNQPHQATFENTLALELLKNKSHRLLLEDESYFVGQVHLPEALRDRISLSPVIKIKVDMETRLDSIYTEYVKEPGSLQLMKQYTGALLKIKKKLGGLLTESVGPEIKRAFESGDPKLHRVWIQSLLVHYYDKMYEFSFQKHKERETIFEGDWQQCKTWIQNQFA